MIKKTKPDEFGITSPLEELNTKIAEAIREFEMFTPLVVANIDVIRTKTYLNNSYEMEKFNGVKISVTL